MNNATANKTHPNWQGVNLAAGEITVAFINVSNDI